MEMVRGDVDSSRLLCVIFAIRRVMQGLGYARWLTDSLDLSPHLFDTLRREWLCALHRAKDEISTFYGIHAVAEELHMSGCYFPTLAFAFLCA